MGVLARVTPEKGIPDFVRRRTIFLSSPVRQCIELAMNSSGPKSLTLTQWMILVVAAIGFAFDIYELLMLPLIIKPAIAALSAPLVVELVRGGMTPPEAADGFIARIPDCRIVWFDECGHAPMIEKPGEFAEAILGFTDELDRRDAAN